MRFFLTHGYKNWKIWDFGVNFQGLEVADPSCKKITQPLSKILTLTHHYFGHFIPSSFKGDLKKPFQLTT